MSTPYKFKDSLEDGEDHEKVLDEYYNKWYSINSVSMLAQKAGIDRTWTNRSDGFRYSVEYKADTTAGRTGNAFIETVSNDATGKKGWAYTSCAQILIYYIPPMKKAYRMTVITLKHMTREWKETYTYVQTIPNEGYNTLGLLVPLSEFEKYCYSIDFIKKENDDE